MTTTTRSSARRESNSQNQNGDAVGSKHELEQKPSPNSKRTKKEDNDNNKKQQTIEDTIPSPTEAYGDGKNIPPPSRKKKVNGENGVKTEKKAIDQNGSAEQEGARNGTVPSNILEKGIIYFFIRGRVGIDEPSSVADIRRSYMVLRPLDKDAKLGEGTISDAGNSRLIAIPKKVLPLSGKDRWIAFVEKSHASFQTLKDEFLSASDYITKTAGTRHSPAASPVAEGIYAITSTGRESHLAYMVTLPQDLGEVQNELGIKEKGSFIISTRNPQYEAPKGTALPQSPDFPRHILDEFRSLRWASTQPKHLDFTNTQFLLVGESSGIAKATDPEGGGENQPTHPVAEELEMLEDEDTHRMQGLQGDDSAAIFADLQARAADYPRLRTTF